MLERKTAIFVLIALFIGVGIGYILGWYYSPIAANQNVSNKTTGEVTTIVPTSTVSKLDGIVMSDSGNILISVPRPGDTITTPLMINGLARSFENRVQIRLKNKDGVEVRKTSFTAKKGEVGTHIALSIDLTFAQPTVPQDGTLEVFTIAPRDGSEVDKVIIPIKFAAHGGSGL
ncbi:Gmad2 immunoglobulin-like domain-containing protein [Candidatus Roizmanbacteria bacterium]|nr:Gmad2 immunoglobulin-like domain-containing protein [Candidatus Roizmanbacteria bacterium]